MNKSSPN